MILTFPLCKNQNVKAYLRRGTAREFLGYYKEADEGMRMFGRVIPFCSMTLTLPSTISSHQVIMCV